MSPAAASQQPPGDEGRSPLPWCGHLHGACGTPGPLMRGADARSWWGCSPRPSRDARWHPRQEGAPAPSSLAPLHPAFVGCPTPAQGFRGGAGGGGCTLARSPSGRGTGARSGQGRTLPGMPLSPCKAKAVPGTAFPRARRAPRAGGTRGTRGCAGSRAAGSCLVGVGEPGKARRSFFTPCKREEEGRNGRRLMGYFLVGEGKEIFWRQQLWSERHGGHHAGAGRGC